MLPHTQSSLSTLYCPIPPVQSPYRAEADRRLQAWVRRYRLAETSKLARRLEHIRVTDFVARAYPDASPTDLDTVLAWTAWAFLADDRADEETDARKVDLAALGSLYADYISTLRDGTRGSAQECAALLDIRARVLARGGSACLARFASAVEDWFASLHWEVTNRAEGMNPTIRAYMVRRRVTVGMYTEFALFDLTHQASDVDALFRDAELAKMMEASSNVIAWSNDIFSYPKEAIQGDPHNLVLLLQSELGHDLNRAIGVARRMHDKEMDRFLTLERQVLRRAAPTLDAFRFMDMMKCWIRSNVDWAQLTGRYELNEHSFSLTSSRQ